MTDRLMPDPPAETDHEPAELHGGRVLAYVLAHGRPAVWCSPDVALERALSVSTYAIAAPALLETARDRIVDARRLMAGELERRRQEVTRAAQAAARLVAQVSPRSHPASNQDDDSGRLVRVEPRPRVNPPAGALADLQF